MKKILTFLAICTFILSCSNNSVKSTLNLNIEIQERLDFLGKSTKFTVFTYKHEEKTFDELKFHIDNLINLKNSEELIIIQNDLVVALQKFDIEFFNESNPTKTDLILRVIFALDDMILKFSHSSIAISDYSTVVVPELTKDGLDEKLTLKIHTRVSDDIYRPEMYYLMPDSNGKKTPVMIESSDWTGIFAIKTKYIQSKTIEGFIKISNELGEIDTLDWKYIYEGK